MLCHSNTCISKAGSAVLWHVRTLVQLLLDKLNAQDLARSARSVKRSLWTTRVATQCRWSVQAMVSPALMVRWSVQHWPLFAKHFSPSSVSNLEGGEWWQADKISKVASDLWASWSQHSLQCACRSPVGIQTRLERCNDPCGYSLKGMPACKAGQKQNLVKGLHACRLDVKSDHSLQSSEPAPWWVCRPSYSFLEARTHIYGRMSQCHCHFPAGNWFHPDSISMHHFRIARIKAFKGQGLLISGHPSVLPHEWYNSTRGLQTGYRPSISQHFLEILNRCDKFVTGVSSD